MSKSEDRVPAGYRKYPDEFDAQLNMLHDDGVTCSECISFSRCVKIGYAKPDNDRCDFYPNRFIKEEKVDDDS